MSVTGGGRVGTDRHWTLSGVGREEPTNWTEEPPQPVWGCPVQGYQGVVQKCSFTRWLDVLLQKNYVGQCWWWDLCLQASVLKALKRLEDVQEMFEKRHVSLKRLSAKQTRPVQPVAPRPESSPKRPSLKNPPRTTGSQQRELDVALTNSFMQPCVKGSNCSNSYCLWHNRHPDPQPCTLLYKLVFSSEHILKLWRKKWLKWLTVSPLNLFQLWLAGLPITLTVASSQPKLIPTRGGTYARPKEASR